MLSATPDLDDADRAVLIVLPGADPNAIASKLPHPTPKQTFVP